MIRVPDPFRPETSKRRATKVTAVILVATAGLAPRESIDFITSLAGAGAVIAFVAGFGSRGTLSLRPWLLTSAGVMAYGAAVFFVDRGETALVLNLAGLVTLVGAATAAYTQRSLASIDDRVEAQARRNAHRNRWGAAWVALAVAIVTVPLRVSRLDWSTELVATQYGAAQSAELQRAPYLPAAVVGRIEHPSLTETSGLVSASRKGRFWLHNDSGDDPWLYCVRETGEACGRWLVDGARAVDWEDIAAYGRHLYIGDIGDNAAERASITVYVVSEPDNGRAQTSRSRTEPAQSIELHFPSGPQDAEAMLIDPASGDLYIMSKGPGTGVPVYKAEAPLGGREPLVRVGTNRVVGLLVDRTSMDVTPDGGSVVIATYGAIYELPLRPGESFEDIWNNKPEIVEDGITAQIEAVAYAPDGSVVFTEEGQNARLWKAGRLEG